MLVLLLHAAFGEEQIPPPRSSADTHSNSMATMPRARSLKSGSITLNVVFGYSSVGKSTYAEQRFNSTHALLLFGVGQMGAWGWCSNSSSDKWVLRQMGFRRWCEIHETDRALVLKVGNYVGKCRAEGNARQLPVACVFHVNLYDFCRRPEILRRVRAIVNFPLPVRAIGLVASISQMKERILARGAIEKSKDWVTAQSNKSYPREAVLQEMKSTNLAAGFQHFVEGCFSKEPDVPLELIHSQSAFDFTKVTLSAALEILAQPAKQVTHEHESDRC